MLKTTYINKQEFRNNLLNVIQDLKTVLMNSTKVLNSNFYATNNDTYHFISQLLTSIDKKDRERLVIHSLISQDIFTCEKLSANSSVVYLSFMIKFLEFIDKNGLYNHFNQQIDQVTLDKALEKFKILVEDTSVVSHKETLKDMIFDNFDDQTLAQVCHEAINLAGLEGKIVVENSKQKNYSIEIKDGYTFNLTPYKFFLKNNIWERKDVKVLTIDGFIENVSEIDQLLIKANELKQPLVLISQGFSEEVIATLYTNFEKGALDVLPLRLKADVGSINVINDIGVVCGRDPISSLKGELLTFVRWDDLPVIDRISVIEKQTTIENKKTYNRVLSQIKMLLEKRSENSFIEDMQILLENRIKSLSPNLVTIYLPEMSILNNESTRVLIDDCLRNVKTVLNYGVFDAYLFSEKLSWNPISQESEDINTPKLSVASNDQENLFFKSLLETLFDVENMDFNIGLLNKSKISSLSFYIGVMFSYKTSLNLLCNGGLVKIDI